MGRALGGRVSADSRASYEEPKSRKNLPNSNKLKNGGIFSFINRILDALFFKDLYQRLKWWLNNVRLSVRLNNICLT